MSLFIIQLFIISAFGLMVQSAPVNDVTKRSTMSKEEINQRKLEKNLYCASQTLYNNAVKLQNKAGFTLPSLPQADIDNTTKAIANKTFDHFSHRCKNFTIAMTLKHQLQERIFSNDTTVEVNSDNAKKLFKILTSLQSLANVFNDMEFIKNNSRCVKLTTAQYRIMYYVRYTALLLESLEDDFEDWYLNEKLYEYTDERHC